MQLSTQEPKGALNLCRYWVIRVTQKMLKSIFFGGVKVFYSVFKIENLRFVLEVMNGKRKKPHKLSSDWLVKML